MKVYIAGPYTKGDVAENVAVAIRAATTVADAGHTPFLPHLYHFWHLMYQRPYTYWTRLDFEWLEPCEAIIRLLGESSGADAEVARAKELGLKVYYSVETFLNVNKL